MNRLVLAVLLLAATLGSAVPAAAERFTWQVDLDASQIPNGISTSPALGQAWLDYQTETDHLQVTVAWTGFEGDLTAIHIHGAARPGESTRTHIFDVFGSASDIPLGLDLREDLYSSVYHLGDAHPDDDVPSGAGHLPLDPALDAMVGGAAYMVFHSEAWPDGEIRGQLPTATSVPEPGTACLLALALGLAGRAGRRG